MAQTCQVQRQLLVPHFLRQTRQKLKFLPWVSLLVDPSSVPDKHLTLGSELLSWLQKELLLRGQFPWTHKAPVHLASKHLHVALVPFKVYIFRVPLWRKDTKGTLVEQALLISYNPPTMAPILVLMAQA